MFAQVLIARSSAELERVFDYEVPFQWLDVVDVGVRVLVPFGRRNAKAEGYILSLSESSDVPKNRIKQIAEVLDKKAALTKAQIALAFWLKERYFCSLNQCLQLMIPSALRTKSTWTVALTHAGDGVLSPREEKCLEFLRKNDRTMTQDEIAEAFRVDMSDVLRMLQSKGYLHMEQKVQKKQFVITKTYYRINPLSADLDLIFEKAKKDKRVEKQKEILEYLIANQEASEAELKEKLEITSSPIKTLLKKEVLLAEKREERRSVADVDSIEKTVAFSPTAEQKVVLSAIESEWQKENKRPILLHGVTGSGKTEVYLQMIAKAIEKGQQAIVLVPEISLTPQMLERFVSRFGSAVSITHSRLSQGERADQWRKARDGEISVMIGPRSALFVPFENLGVVIIDEFHETSYVSETTPRYDAREVALEMARQSKDVLLIMGSATPDIAYYHQATEGMFLLLTMKERTGNGRLPRVDIVDMRKELGEGNRTAFSLQLQQEIRKNLENKEQTMLFLNRRGYATFVSCRSCGHVMKCPDCEIAYTQHVKQNMLHCHYCGKTETSPTICPVCGSKYIRYFGTGTQKIEDEVKKLFPTARVLRMDFDTTTTKGSYQTILQQFSDGKADILIGTQMIAKGHDFPNVTLVGILAADLSLHVGGYRASEITFQLLTQAAGRAGRHDLAGRVLIQTYQPENYCIRHAAKQEYEPFYQDEMIMRQMLAYPPFYSIFSIGFSGEDKEQVGALAQRFMQQLRQASLHTKIHVLSCAPQGKLRGDYRWQILSRSEDESALSEFVLQEVKKIGEQKGITLNLIRNPQQIV